MVLSQDVKAIFAECGKAFVVANNKNMNPSFLTDLKIGRHDVAIVFNRHQFEIPDFLTDRVLWVHRFDDGGKRYFGYHPESDAENPVKRIFVSEKNKLDIHFPTEASHLSTCEDFEMMSRYPIGRRLLRMAHPRTITSPTTGFIIFSLLMHLKNLGCRLQIRAYGFGGDYNGWRGHDWGYEWRALAKTDARFYRPDGTPDRYFSIRACIPYGLARKIHQFYPSGLK